jgi:hypothetical protein
LCLYLSLGLFYLLVGGSYLLSEFLHLSLQLLLTLPYLLSVQILIIVCCLVV